MTEVRTDNKELKSADTTPQEMNGSASHNNTENVVNMSENVVSISNEMVGDATVITSNTGDNRIPKSAQPRLPFQPQPQRPQFENQLPRFPQNTGPRFTARTPEFPQRLPFPPSSSQPLNQDPRVRLPLPGSTAVQRPPVFGGGRPPGPFVQRPGSNSVRPFPVDTTKSQNLDSKGNLDSNLKIGEPPKAQNFHALSKEVNENIEEKLNKRNEEFKSQIPYKKDDEGFIQQSSKEYLANSGKLTDAKVRNSDDLQKDMKKPNVSVEESSTIINKKSEQTSYSDRSLSKESVAQESPKIVDSNINNSPTAKINLKMQNKTSAESGQPAFPNQGSKEAPYNITSTTINQKDPSKDNVDSKPSENQLSNLKSTYQSSNEQLNRSDSKPPSREATEIYKRKEDSRPTSRGPNKLNTENSRQSGKETPESPKLRYDSRTPNKGSEDQPRSISTSRPSSRPSSRLQTTVEQEATPGRGGKISNSERNTKVEITVSSPQRKNDTPIKHKPVANNTNQNVDKNPTMRPTILNRSDSFKSSMESPYLLKPDGDNDSGVDESTQGNDTRNNEHHKSAKKSSKIPSPKSSATPTKERSIIKGSKSPSLRSPGDISGATTPGTEKKKLPMNKIQVGAAPSPNIKEVKSKIGSLSNASYKPGGGQVKIENRKLNFEAKPKIAAKNDAYTPHGGEKKIMSQKLQWNAKSKIGSLENATHKPKGGDKKIESVKLDFKEKAKPKVGSKDNIKYTPGGGDVKKEEEVSIENKKLEIKAQSKIGSLDNVKHKPGGGDIKIFDDKDYIRQMSGNSLTTSLTNSQTSSQADVREPTSDENLNKQHR